MNKPTANLSVLTSLWIVAILAGLFVLMKYEFTPANPTFSPTYWPRNSSIPLQTDIPTLVMFAHPKCPCTRASLIELRHLVARSPIKFKAYVALFEPQCIPAHWQEDSLCSAVQAVPGVIALKDLDGIEAARFHSLTSGQTVIYSPKGQLIFSGGLTAARGQEGENINSSFAELALEGKSTKIHKTPVFGCSLISTKPLVPRQSN